MKPCQIKFFAQICSQHSKIAAYLSAVNVSMGGQASPGSFYVMALRSVIRRMERICRSLLVSFP
ncbi:hypothetical protein MPQ_1986 [Methylovorus sp. MP688]|nr:hypothetical protein MPQ_1986 [Methylovorus sp. MP688]